MALSGASAAIARSAAGVPGTAGRFQRWRHSALRSRLKPLASASSDSSSTRDSDLNANATPVTRVRETTMIDIEEAQNAALPSFTDVMGVFGSAPEIANGRMTMVAVVAALGAEAMGKGPIALQYQESKEIVIPFVLVFIVATTFPLFRGVELEDLSVFTVDAELTNARLSMLAFAAMLALEAHFQTTTIDIIMATLGYNGTGLDSLLPTAFPRPLDLPGDVKVELDIPKQLSSLKDRIAEVAGGVVGIVTQRGAE